MVQTVAPPHPFANQPLGHLDRGYIFTKILTFLSKYAIIKEGGS